MNIWWKFWSDVFHFGSMEDILFDNICWIISPCNEMWAGVYYYQPPANDNGEA